MGKESDSMKIRLGCVSEAVLVGVLLVGYKRLC